MFLRVTLFASVLYMATLSITCQAESETEQVSSAEADSPPGHMAASGLSHGAQTTDEDQLHAHTSGVQ